MRLIIIGISLLMLLGYSITDSYGAATKERGEMEERGERIEQTEMTEGTERTEQKEVAEGTEGMEVVEGIELERLEEIEQAETVEQVEQSSSLDNIIETTTTEIAPDSVATKRGLFKRIGDYFKDSNKDETTTKKFDFSIIGGPHYSSDVKLGLGLVAAGLFRTDRNDTISPPSNVSFAGDISTSGFWMLGIRGNTFFNHTKYRLDYGTFFYSLPTKLWGVGYDMANHAPNEINYRRQQVKVKVDFMYQLTGKLYIGTNVDFSHTAADRFDDWVSDDYYILGQSRRHVNTGLGIFLLYDSRDYITAAHSGWYFKFENIFFPKFFGNKLDFNRTEITLNYYHKVWKGGVMAYDMHMQNNSGNVPWVQMAQLGSSNRMRGYYEGRYRDKSLIEVQAELRQNIWRRIGFTVWAGAGNIFPKLSGFDFSHTLPNYGVGLRWEFKSRVNVRLDYGFGKGESGFIFSINEAF